MRVLVAIVYYEDKNRKGRKKVRKNKYRIEEKKKNNEKLFSRPKLSSESTAVTVHIRTSKDTSTSLLRYLGTHITVVHT